MKYLEKKLIRYFKLHRISYLNTIEIINFTLSSFVAARILVHFGLGFEKRINAASGLHLASWQLWLGVSLLHVITIFQL